MALSKETVEQLRLVLEELRSLRRDLEAAGAVKPRPPKLHVVSGEEKKR